MKSEYINKNQTLIALRATVIFTVLTGFLYPLLMTGLGKLFFSESVSGNLLSVRGKVIGSSLIAQKFENPKYFSGRPSAADFATVPSGASNLGATSAPLKEAIEKRKVTLGKDAPVDLLTTSGSGLDPHISREGAKYQIAKILSARKLPPEKAFEVESLIDKNLESLQFGILGTERINVLLLNLALDEKFP